MKRFLFLAIALMGCVTSPENGSGSWPTVLPPDGEYQSKDNALLFTLNYPNWKASYYTKTPALYVEGKVDSVHADSAILTAGEKPYGVNYTAYFSVISFYEKTSDGSILRVDSSIVRALGFYGKTMTYNTPVLIEPTDEALKTGMHRDTSFVFTGHKLR